MFRRIEPASKATSIVTPIEVLTFCQSHGRPDLGDQYRRFFLDSDEVEVVPVDWAVADWAAGLRGRYRLRLGDSIQIATAIHYRADAFITNDRSLARVSEVPVLILDDLRL